MQAWWAEERSLKTLQVLLFKYVWLVVYIENRVDYLLIVMSLIPNYMMKIVVINIIHYITYFRKYNQTTFRLLLTKRVYHIDVNRIILFHINTKIQ